MQERNMPATLRFMLAARRSELLGLEDLSHTCALVTRISQLVHALQKERGYSNLYLSGNVPQQRQQLDSLSEAASSLEHQVRDDLDRLDEHGAGAADKARLLTRIAYALHCLDELPALRRRIRELRISMHEATASLVRLIGSLLAVVFEAADSAVDPDIARSLVALFNFMQGKELAGQERALGVAGFASSFFTTEMLERLEHLWENQERCFETFSHFASPTTLMLWRALCASPCNLQACRLREIARRTHANAQVDRQLGELWFELHTARIDAMQTIEARLEHDLMHRCQQSMQRIRCDLQHHRRLLAGLSDMHAAAEQAKLFSVHSSDLDSPTEEGPSAHLARSTRDLLHSQNLHLQSMHDQLHTARRALDERQQVERAKRLLIKKQGCSESEAYAQLRQAAMNQGLRLEEVAQRLVALNSEPSMTRARQKH